MKSAQELLHELRSANCGDADALHDLAIDAVEYSRSLEVRIETLEKKLDRIVPWEMHVPPIHRLPKEQQS